jgi:hypothetical protein
VLARAGKQKNRPSAGFFVAALFRTLPRGLSRFALLEAAVPTPWRFPLHRLFLRFGAANCCRFGYRRVVPDAAAPAIAHSRYLSRLFLPSNHRKPLI